MKHLRYFKLSEKSTWSYTNHGIVKKYQFSSIESATKFSKACMDLFSSEGHHPDSFTWRNLGVEISLTTHSVGRVTESDLELSKKLDELYEMV